MTIPQFEAPQIAELQLLLPAYEFLDFIAKGGMGAVYRARQITLDREVAIKVLPREFGGDADFRKSFETEARAMAKLNHPNLIAVYDFGEVEGMPYIVMEYVHGKALHYSAHGQCIEQIEAAQLILGICDGLAHAHDAGILHRDIKPANILLDAKRLPKIGDFGLASPIEAGKGPFHAEAFVIEWSADHEVQQIAGAPRGGEALKILQNNIRKDIIQTLELFRKEVRENTNAFKFELGGWPGRQPRGEAMRAAPAIARIQESVNMDGRFDWAGKGAPLHPNLEKLVNDCLARQSRLESAVREKLEKRRRFYIDTLQKNRAKLEENGLKGEVRNMDNEIAACADLDRFIKHLTGDNLQAPGTAAAPNMPANVAFIECLQTVSFRSDNGSQIRVDGEFMAQITPSGARVANFKPCIQRIDADQQTVRWNYHGKGASLTIDQNRRGGVWTRTGGQQQQVTVTLK